MGIARTFRHLCSTRRATRRRFTPEALRRIEAAIAAVEGSHAGEIRFAIETAFDLPDLWYGTTPRERAVTVFGHLGVWDTELNNGVLIYVLWADHDVEIVADRGFRARVSEQEWRDICLRMQKLFASGAPKEASVEGIRAVGQLIARHFPAADRNELPNRPVLL